MDIGLTWALRTPIGKKGGRWAHTPPEQLMSFLLEKAASQYPFPQEVILASATTAGGNPARVACLMAGLPVSIPALTLDAQCLGSAKAILVGRAALLSDAASIVWVGGMESASLPPTRGFHPNDPRFQPNHPFYTTALFTPWDTHQPMTSRMAPLLADFDTNELNNWGRRSKELAWHTQQEEFLSHLLFPPGKDEWIARPKSAETWELILEKIKSRVIHPLNCAPEADGAALIGLTREPAAILLKGGITYGIHPDQAALACVAAVDQLLTQHNLNAKEIDLWEIHEAFALKPIAVLKKWGINPEKVNIFGGNLAYGHPFGASGAVGVMHLMEGLKHSKVRRGIFTMSAAGGLGIALLLEYQG